MKIKLVFTDPYFQTAPWLNFKDFKRPEYIVLDGETGREMTALFFCALFDYNHIEFGNSMEMDIDALLSEDCLILSGGTAFFIDAGRYILPSCCCGIECWKEIFQAVRDRESPWLGHDPTPIFSYEGENLYIWSDDPGTNPDSFSILTSIDGFLQHEAQVQQDLDSFLAGPFRAFLSENAICRADEIVEKVRVMLADR